MCEKCGDKLHKVAYFEEDDNTWDTFQEIVMFNKTIVEAAKEVLKSLKGEKKKAILDKFTKGGYKYDTVRIENNVNPCQVCKNEATKTYKLYEFTQRSRNVQAIDTGKVLDEPAPLFVRTHPGCNCSLVVSSQNASEYLPEIVFDWTGIDIDLEEARDLCADIMNDLEDEYEGVEKPEEVEEPEEEETEEEEGEEGEQEIAIKPETKPKEQPKGKPKAQSKEKAKPKTEVKKKETKKTVKKVEKKPAKKSTKKPAKKVEKGKTSKKWLKKKSWLIGLEDA